MLRFVQGTQKIIKTNQLVTGTCNKSFSLVASADEGNFLEMVNRFFDKAASYTDIS
jgi:hypothetical protein